VGGTRYISLERNPEFAAVTLSLIDLAGLSDLVTVRVGPSDQGLQYLHQSGLVDQIDLMFIDHYKPAYVTDLKLCEELKLVRPGSVLAADNVIKPGNPPYLEYVRSSVAEKLKKLEDLAGGADVDGQFQAKISKQYEKREGTESLDSTLRGNPRLVYESTMIHSFEPTGVPDAIEITRCVGEEKTKI
jgi:catechol O-methyltransferase